MKKNKLFILLVLLQIICNHIVSAQNAIYVGNTPQKNTIQLKWFNPEMDLSKTYNIYRKEGENGVWVKINTAVIKGNAEGSSEDALAFKHYLLTLSGKDTVAIAMEKYFLMLRVFKSNALSKMMAMYYEDENIVQGKTYSYQLKQINQAGEEEFAISPPIQAEGFKKNIAPQKLETISASQPIQLNWQLDSTAMLYQVYRSQTVEFKNEELIKIIFNPMWDNLKKDSKFLFSDNDTTMQNAKSYYYKISSTDIFGNETEKSNLVSANYFTKSQLAPVSNIKAVIVKDAINLTWSPSSSKACTGYLIYRSYTFEKEYEQITPTQLTSKTVSFTDKINTQGKKLFYYIESVDANNNRNASYKITTSIPDNTAPAVPSNLSAKPTSGKIYLSWNKNTERDLMGYYIFRGLKNETGNFNLLNPYPLKENFYNDSLHKEARNQFVYKVCSVDSSWNRSELTPIVTVAMPDVVPPSQPTLKSIFIDKNKIVIVWAKLRDVNLNGYELLRKETSVLRSVFEKINAKLISGSDTTYFDEQIETGKSYAYQIVAMDEGGNKSTPSKPLSIHYLNSEKPKLPNNVRIVFEKEKKQNKITWEVLKQPPTFAGYMVFRKEVGRNYSPVSRIISATEFVDTRLMEEVKYYYKIKVCLTDGTLVENEKEFNP